MTVSTAHRSSPSTPRSFRIARNRCTRTVAGLIPVAALISAGRALVEMRQREHQPLPIRQPRDRVEHLLPPLPDEQLVLTRRLAADGLFDRPRLVRLVGRARYPALLPAPALQPVQAGIDENPHEPHIERQLLAVLLDMQEHLDEGVLHGLVGVRRIPQIVIGDAEPAPLEQRHQRAEPVPRRLAIAGHDERLDLARQRGGWRRRGVRGPARLAPVGDFDRSS